MSYAGYMFVIFIFVVDFLTIPIAFIGICLYIVVLYEDLMDVMRKIDICPPAERYSRIVDCIKYHNDIIA